jgi:ABC-type sugar transport system ATPase subunit
VGTSNVEDVTNASLVQMMVGRPLSETFPPRNGGAGETVLSVRNVNREGVLSNISMDLRAGEIVGLAGLVGAGRTELARVVFGSDRVDSGTIELHGKSLKIRGPHDAVRAGIVLVPEDRKLEGLVEMLSVRKNIGLPNLDILQRWGFVRRRQEQRIVGEKLEQLDIRASSPRQLVMNLSGGNQQKVALGKWLVRQPEVIVFDEPTRGIDVGAKAEFYRIMRELANSGAAILMISSELPEIMGMADRILVMHEGSLVAELDGATATEEKVMFAATGGDTGA